MALRCSRRRGGRGIAVLLDQILLPRVVALLLRLVGLFLLAARVRTLRQRLLRHVRHVLALLRLLLVLLHLVAHLLLLRGLLEARIGRRRLRRRSASNR